MAYGFVSYPYSLSNKASGNTMVSVIIAAKNEEENIISCLQSIVSQTYPNELFEIIVVDDGSNDQTYHLSDKFLSNSKISYRLIKNHQSIGKKQSIRKAVSESKGTLIVTRDADTFTTSNEWLAGIVNYYSISNKEFIIGPIAISPQHSLLSSFQETETKVLTVFTGAAVYFNTPFLCNGANLAFTKDLFYRTNSYENHLHLASGDDVLFLEEVRHLNKNCIGYLKNENCIVYTYPQKDLKSLFEQKARWSGKIFRSRNFLNWLTASIIAICNFTWLLAFIYFVFDPKNSILALFFVFSKLLIDILLVFLASRFVKTGINWALLLVTGFLYPVYSLIVTLAAVFTRPKWK